MPYLPRLNRNLLTVLVSIAVLGAAMVAGRMASAELLVALPAIGVMMLVMQRPKLGLGLLIVCALLVNVEISTGSTVKLNATTLLIPALFGLHVLRQLRKRERLLPRSSLNLPLSLLLVSLLISLVIGRATWNAAIPLTRDFLPVQLAQWAIVAFSVILFWLSADLLQTPADLQRLTRLFILIGGILAIAITLTRLDPALTTLIPITIIRAPFWVLLTAFVSGEILYSRSPYLTLWNLFLLATLAAILYFALVLNRDSSSTWVGVGATLGTLLWLRFKSLRIPLLIFIISIFASGTLFARIWEFAGGDDAWFSTGGSRLVLIQRVLEVTEQNPITGLGPAAYRPYANAEPLRYAHIFWTAPRVSSHNNYVDLYAHGGLLGLSLFLWFAFAALRSMFDLRKQIGFTGQYANMMLAAWVGALMLMLLADWIVPFVYNIGFPGFQASALVWLFLGGVVMLQRESRTTGTNV